MERAEVDRWLEQYVAAWMTYERSQIADLFSDDVTYRYHPYDDPIQGRESLLDSWLGEGDFAHDDWRRDQPGTYDASYRAVAVDGDSAVATGTSTYLTEPGGTLKATYHNCFIMRFDGSGRCREFTEWFMLEPASGGRS